MFTSCSALGAAHRETVVMAVAELLPASGSASAALTVAVFVTVPAVFGFTTIVIVAPRPLAIVPRLHVIACPLLVHLPCEVLSERNSSVDGNVSLTVTAVAGAGPALATPIV